MANDQLTVAKHLLFGVLLQNIKDLTETEKKLGRDLLEDEEIKDTLFLIKRNKALLN